jgi:hypothetical protein
LMQIGRQAGIRISSGPSSGKRVSAHFSSVDLEEGLRRLLRVVSEPYILYAQGPQHGRYLRTARVGEGKESTPGPATVTAQVATMSSISNCSPQGPEASRTELPSPKDRRRRPFSRPRSRYPFRSQRLILTREQSEVARRFIEAFKLAVRWRNPGEPRVLPSETVPSANYAVS